MGSTRISCEPVIIMYTKLAAAALLVACVTGAATIDDNAVTSNRRRSLGGKCFTGCNEQYGKRKHGFFNPFRGNFLECDCNEGSAGNCCNDCEVPTIDTIPIELEEWTRASWYVQKQQVNGFQSANDLNCVVATYDLGDTKVFFNPKTDIIDVNNYGNSGGVNGPVQGGVDNGILCGRVTGEPGKLAVAPCFLPNFLAGPYWVAGLGTSDVDGESRYDWAVIIGGQPKEFAPDGKCTTSLDDINNSGLWFFSRTPVAPTAQIAAMEQVIADLGVSNSLLINVPQEGCNYDGALIKANN